MKVSEKIYKLRTDLGLSQKEFADQIGTSQSAINYWENGKREPRNNQLRKIATKYDIPLYVLSDDSFDMWDINDPLNKNRARIIGDTRMEKLPRITMNTPNKADNNSSISKQGENCFSHILQKNSLINKGEASDVAVSLCSLLASVKQQIHLEEWNLKQYHQQANTEGIAETQERLRELKDIERLLDYYRYLNCSGQAEARKRIQELTEIKKYTEPEE